MMATVQAKWSRAAPAKVPWLDPAKTRVSKPMDPWTALLWIDSQVKEPDDGVAWRARERVRAVLAGLLLAGDDGYHVVVYVRGANPPPRPIEVRPPALAVITWRPLEGTLAGVRHAGGCGRITPHKPAGPSVFDVPVSGRPGGVRGSGREGENKNRKQGGPGGPGPPDGSA